MGGKGQRRREKNYNAAHGGGYARLPPPPKPSDIDALPSKLRKLMEFTSHKVNNNENPPSEPTITTLRSSKVAIEDRVKGKKKGSGGEKKPSSKDETDSKPARFSEEGNDEKIVTPEHNDSENEDSLIDTDDKKKTKWKRRQVNDLRFDATQGRPTGLKRKERKKKYLEAKKNKHKKAKTEEDSLGFQGHEKIRFGEVVEAPPRLSAIPKALKTVQAASQERLRLQAVEAYRNRKKWVSRPGIQLPTSVIADSSF